MTVFEVWPCAEGEISRHYLDKNKTIPPLAVNFLFTSLLPIFLNKQILLGFFMVEKVFPNTLRILKYHFEGNTEISFGIFCCWLSGSLGVNIFCYSIM